MAKNMLDDRYFGKWYLNPNINWSNIGADVVSRPTELTAFNHIAQESEYLRKLVAWDIEFTRNELLILKWDVFVNSNSFDYTQYKMVLKKDTNIRKISKITGFSEPYVLRTLNNITRKMYIREILGMETNTNTILNSPITDILQNKK